MEDTQGFTQEAIDALAVDEEAILKRIAQELDVRTAQVTAVISLIKEGSTIPFIARYRKEAHGSLDEVKIRDCGHLFTSYKNLEDRRLEIVRAIFGQGKLTESLYKAVMGSKTLVEMEDLYAPFKKKKKTRGMVAIEKGLTPLADFMMTANDKAVEEEAKKYVSSEAADDKIPPVLTAEDAIQGAKDILAERTAQDTANREGVYALYMAEGRIVTKGVGDEEAAKTSTYQMYWDYSEPLAQLKPHRVLAINRGEREGILDVTLDVDIEGAVSSSQRKAMPPNRYYKDAIEDGVVRLLSPAVLREIRSDETDAADAHGIGVFSENLKNLLMAQPIKGSRVLGVDPGIRTGTKCAALDETGKYLGHFLIKQVADPAGAYKALADAIDKYDIKVVAVGNGTGSQEVEKIVSKVISENYKDVLYTVVDESGASVYSASDIAREEFPDLDLTIRGAISMGRRLQDPLSELVKIDPKAIGVGLYQHDVNQKRLSDTLDEVVGSVVNNVGVNLNTASFSLLKYVSGITSSTAKKIVGYRDEHGKITSREELKSVKGLGPKAFEQCAGFLKIPESADPLDNTWVHPENYDAAREVLPFIQSKEKVPKELRQKLAARYNLGEQTITDIIEELQKPNRDPRDGYPPPIMQKGVVQFEDLKTGMKVTGKIRNVVDFGAFVDIGLHETALIHISELSDSFVKNPINYVKVGDVKEFTILSLDADRRRISLSLKSDARGRAVAASMTQQDKTASAPRGKGLIEVHSLSLASGGKKKVVLVHKGGGSKAALPVVKANQAEHSTHKAERPSRGEERNKHNDGMTYNPFATLLKR